MRIDTHCFTDFCKYLEEQYLLEDCSLEDYYTVEEYGFVRWSLPSIREVEVIYQRAYDDSLNRTMSLR